MIGIKGKGHRGLQDRQRNQIVDRLRGTGPVRAARLLRELRRVEGPEWHNARVDGRIQDEMSKFLEEIGLDPSDL